MDFLVTKHEVGECGGRRATLRRLFFNSVGGVKLVDKAAVIEFLHELSIDQSLSSVPPRRDLQPHQALDVAQAFEEGKGFRSVA